MARKYEDRVFWPWADLKFICHERMVLFYSTFVALKRQDLTSVPKALIEDPRDMEEDMLFSGIICDRDMYHTLLLLQDPSSEVLRLEARPCRGDKEEVPIWVAFLSKYRDDRDRDIFNLEGGGLVSMICPKPKPYIFVQDYVLPCMSNGEFALQFSKRDGEATSLLLNPLYIHRSDADDLLFCRCQTFDRNLDGVVYCWKAVLRILRIILPFGEQDFWRTWDEVIPYNENGGWFLFAPVSM
jgi:hypothetical protein